MRKRSIDRILRDAVIADAEAQGRQLFPEFEEIPEASQARFDAALYGRARTEKETEPSPTPAPQRYSTRPQGRFGCVVNFGIGVATVVAILVAVFTLGIFGGSKKGMEGQPAEEPPIAEATPQPGGAPPEAQPTSEPEMTAAPVSEPEPTNEPEQGEPLPYASATFADESEAVARMKHFYEENRTLLTAVAEDLKAPEHGYIENGVVYSIKENGFADLDHPYASMTDAIRAFLALPDSGDYILHWNDDASLFSVSLRWTNDEGYYSTQLVFSKDAGFLINHYLYERKGVTLEPVTEDGAWGVYTVCWQKAPYWCDSSYAPKQTVGVWGTDDDLLYLELSDDGTARIADLFGEHDIRAHFAWRYDRDYIRLTFSDQTVVKTAELNTDTDAMTLMLADGDTIKATRANGVVLPLRASDTDRTRNPITLPAVCPAYALGTRAEKAMEGILFLCDLDGDGTEETVSFRQSPDDGETPVIICIDETEYPLHELNMRDKVRQTILMKPDPASDDLALVVTTDDFHADWSETAILLLHGREVREIKTETNDAYAYLQDGTLRITARCWLMGTYYGSRAYAGANLEPASEWYETGVLDIVKDWTREEQIGLNRLFEVVRDLPCTIDGQPAVIEPGTWVYLLRWKDTDDYAEIMTEDGRVALLAFTEEYDQTHDMHSYCIDGVDAKNYFDNLCMAG